MWVWILLLNLGISVAGWIVYVYIARHYHRRQRGEGYYCHEVVEEYYSRTLSTSQEQRNYGST